MPKSKLLLFITALAAAIPTVTAEASTVTLDGDVLTVRGAPGEKNWLTVGPNDDPSKLTITDISAPTADPSLCVPDEYAVGFLTCITPAGGVKLLAGDGDDIIDVHEELPAGLTVVGDGGPGKDTLRGPSFSAFAETLLGGDGPDTITGGQGPDKIDGGSGDDEIEGREGADEIRAGDGNDKLMPDYWEEQSDDVVDGGAGYDQIELGWTSGSGKAQPPIDVSVDGVANDGRPGEHDDVTAIERIYSTAPATLTGSEGPDELTVFNTDATGSRLNGRGGDDKLAGFDLADAIDGGAGADTIEGGYGDDTITGGPGRDTINADVSGASCHWIQCRNPYGNDTVDARDGEADSITCGVGTDTVSADPIDTVAPDCESVTKDAGPARDDDQPQQPLGPDVKPVKPTVAVTALKARRRGAFVTVTGRATGTTKVTITATRAGRRVVKATARVRTGRFTARLRVKRGRVRIAAAAGASKASLTVR